jgi:hypothetical protein
VDRRAKVELYEQIRREYEHGGGTIRGIARKWGIHRRMVREAVLSAVPVARAPHIFCVKSFCCYSVPLDRRQHRHSALPEGTPQGSPKTGQ